MNIVEFEQQNVVFGKDQPEYLPLPAYLDREKPEQAATFCFQMTDEELEACKNNGGNVYFQQLTFGAPLQPVRASINVMELIL